MNLNVIPLVDWSNGVLSAIVLGIVFLGLIVALFLLMFSGKKKNS